jgi:uncharacterized protein YecT (DUF1311 family)
VDAGARRLTARGGLIFNVSGGAPPFGTYVLANLVQSDGNTIATANEAALFAGSAPTGGGSWPNRRCWPSWPAARKPQSRLARLAAGSPMKKIAAVLFCLLATPAMGAEITKHGNAISISGHLDHGDEKKFEELTKGMTDAVIWLDSRGGYNRPASLMGYLIRSMNYETRLRSGATCMSACTLIFFAGTYRSMEPGSKLGFHSAFRDTGPKVRDDAYNKFVADYLTWMGAPQQIIDLQRKADPCCVNYVSYIQAKNWGVLKERPGLAGATARDSPTKPPVSYPESLHWLLPKVGARSADAQIPAETNESKPQELLERLQNECAEEILLTAITFCLREKEEEFGKELDQVYKKALALAGTNRPLLLESQRGWLKYQESNCKLQGQLATEGEMYKRNHEAHCLLKMTLERLEELRWIVGCLNREF